MIPLWLLCACQTSPPPPLVGVLPQDQSDTAVSLPPRSGLPTSVSTERMSEISRVLASDEFQGRSMGTAGEDKTVAYLTDQFRSAGLQPGGENGGWTQMVPLIRTKLQSPQVSVRQASSTTQLNIPSDIYLSTVRDTQQASITNAPIVFVGFGVHAPERGWDDFKGVDLKGKIALFLVNDPDFEAAPGEPVADKFGGKTMT